MKPHWETKHDWWKEDFREWVSYKLFFLSLLRQYPGDPGFLETIKNIDKMIRTMQKEYKKIYGANMNLRRLE